MPDFYIQFRSVFICLKIRCTEIFGAGGVQANHPENMPTEKKKRKKHRY